MYKDQSCPPIKKEKITTKSFVLKGWLKYYKLTRNATKRGWGVSSRVRPLNSIFLSAGITTDCALLKKTLLTGFSKTADNYRLDFRHTKIRVGKNYQRFSIHLIRLFQVWLEAYELPNIFKALKELMLLNLFLTILTQDLRIFI